MDKQPAPRRYGHHPRLRPRRISPAARLPSNRGFRGIPRSLSVLLLDSNAEVIPADARGTFHLPPAADTPTAMPSDGQLGDEFGYAERIEC